MHDTIILRSVDEAQADILRSFAPLPAQEVPLLESLGRTLAVDVVADSDIPPFINSAMDGYAVLAADVEHATPTSPVRLTVVGDVAAGHVSERQVRSGTAIRIMTGAPLPAGADAVVPFEATDEQRPDSLRSQGAVRVYQMQRPGANIRPAAEDMRAGEVVLRAGTLIRTGEIGVLATVGAAKVRVYRKPRVAILATGDELVEVEECLGPGQIRNSNGYANAAQVLAAGGEVLQLPIARDQQQEIVARIEAGLEWGADLFLSSGGVSVGDFDVVKQVLTDLGEMAFWRVRMKPGKPLAFGHIRGVPLFGLPGNPVSAMVCFELFTRPALLTLQGRSGWQRPIVHAVFADTLTELIDRRQYVRVVVRPEGHGWIARLTGNQGSGLLTSMAKANGLMLVPEQTTVSMGATMPVMMLDWPEWS